MIIGVAMMLPSAIWAQDDKLVRLAAPQALIDSGLLKYALPRFSLKTQVRVTLVPEAQATMILGDTGRALFQGLGQVWHMALVAPDHPGTKRLADWLQSDVGTRTITSFAPGGVAEFTLPQVATQEVVELAFEGDVDLGLRVSQVKCGRCHKVDRTRRMVGIGSTPSFPVLRSLADWEERFAAFYVLNPHPAFTIIEDVTDPFPEDRPSPIVPVEMTLDEVEAMLAYVAALKPADLGAPLQAN